MERNVLLRGQSNAHIVLNSPDWNAIATQVGRLLGFNGGTGTVNVLAYENQSAEARSR